MKKYEIMYILKADLDEAVRNETVAKLHEILTSHGATIEDVNEWGLKTLAYPIKGKDNIKGYYVVIKVTAGNEAINEFNRLVKFNQKVLRHLVINEN